MADATKPASETIGRHRSEDLIFADVRLRGVMEDGDLARKVKMRWPLLL
jgi:hypothetical protein